ncbi:MAG: hypothetical protein ACN4GT_04030, partial [Gammaproteobacteria bacterium]
ERDMQPVWRDLHRENYDIYLLEDKLILERDGVPINVSIYAVDGGEARRAIYPLHVGFVSKTVRILWWVAAAKAQKSSIRPVWPTHPVSLGKRLLTSMLGVLPVRARGKMQSVAFRASITAGCHTIDWRVPAEFFSDFRSIEFSDDDWLIPARSSDYLQFRYGADWRTPRRDFSSIRDDGAIRR